MSTALLEFLASAAIIVVSGIGMARTVDTISRVTGLGQLLGGALLVATATSLPDLLVGINAVNRGWVDLAVGDPLGAALINMLVLAALDMLKPSRGRMLSRAAAAHALSGTMSMTLLALVGTCGVHRGHYRCYRRRGEHLALDSRRSVLPGAASRLL